MLQNFEFSSFNSTATAPQFVIFKTKRKHFLSCLTSTPIKACNMHTVFYEVFYLRQTIILCYEVFERNGIMKNTAAYFFKKVRWLS